MVIGEEINRSVWLKLNLFQWEYLEDLLHGVISDGLDTTVERSTWDKVTESVLDIRLETEYMLKKHIGMLW